MLKSEATNSGRCLALGNKSFDSHVPMCLIFPAALHSSSAARVSSSGTSAGSGRSGYLSVLTAAREALAVATNAGQCCKHGQKNDAESQGCS